MKRWRIKFARQTEYDPVVLVNHTSYIVESNPEYPPGCNVYSLDGTKLEDPNWPFKCDFNWHKEYLDENSIPDHSEFDNALNTLLGDDDESV